MNTTPSTSPALATLEQNMRFLCDEARMLAGITVAYGTETQSESRQYGRAQEFTRTGEGFSPCVRALAPDTIYDLASLTKLFTAVTTLILVSQGRLRLDEYVGRIDARFANLQDVTVFDVLCFRANLQTPGRIDDAPDREEGLRRLFQVRACPLPAVRVYSDINAMVVKYVVEAKTGLAFFDAVRRLILAPTGMDNTFSAVPDALRPRCACYNYEHRIAGERWLLRTQPDLGDPHDPKALFLSCGGRDLCGHAGLFSTRQDMVRLAQALLGGELLPHELLLSMGENRTGLPNGDGTYRQYLGFLCFSKHPLQRLSEVPGFMGNCAFGLSGFTGNHLSIDPEQNRFVLFLGNRCHARVSHITPPDGMTLSDYGLDADGVGLVRWSDGRLLPSSARYVYMKDSRLHAPVKARMQELGWL